MSKTIPLEVAQELSLGYGDPGLGIEFVVRQYQDTTRWETHYLTVFVQDGVYYGMYDSEGSTEYQESDDPYDRFADYNSTENSVGVFEVEGIETIEYRKLKT